MSIRTLCAALLFGPLGVAACSATGPAPGTPATPAFDVIIAGGRMVDGTGAPWVSADVGIRGDRIAAIGRLDGQTAARRIDATGMVVAPGFIDMLGQSEFNVLVDGRAASKVTQGVTTEITGEGTSIAPLNDRMFNDWVATFDRFRLSIDFHTLDEYFTRLETRSRPAINLGTFVGAGGLRSYVVGDSQREATAAELDRMKALVASAMEQGALGLSTSLQYVPSRFASTDELVELATVAAKYGGIYISHQRSESGLIDSSLDEVFTIARRAHIPAEVWHLKTAYKANWGRMPAVLARFDQARADGLDVTFDMYPYDRASNGLDACLPLWVRDGGLEPMLGRLRDRSLRDRIRREMDDPNITEWENQWYGSGGAAGVMLSAVVEPSLKQYEGMNFEQIGAAMGKDPRDAVMDIVVADRGRSDVIIAIMDDRDVRTALAHPLMAIGTDSGARAVDGPLAASKSHPRGWGSFPRILARYVREERLLTLEEAIRRFTSRAAWRVGLTDRGILRPGMKADVTVFNPSTVRDVATFEDPARYSEGITFVLVNGQAVVDSGKITDARPGEVIRGPGYARK
ncbi:MAG: amidohydrolase family protein [Vicinamibacterales bacterium]